MTSYLVYNTTEDDVYDVNSIPALATEYSVLSIDTITTVTCLQTLSSVARLGSTRGDVIITFFMVHVLKIYSEKWRRWKINQSGMTLM